MYEKMKEEQIQKEIKFILEPELAIKPEESSTIENMQEEDESIIPMQALKNALQNTTTEDTQKAKNLEEQLDAEKKEK